MVQPIPLRPDAPQPDAPLDDAECLVINALLREDEFNPAAYGLREEMFTTWSKAYLFCLGHQQRAGFPPSLELFAASFPTFTMCSGVDPGWAADQLRGVFAEAELRRQLQAASAALREGDMDAARKAVADAAKPSDIYRPKGLEVMDPSVIEDSPVKVGVQMPWPTLQELTGGVGFGETLTLGARYGIGKSYLATLFAIEAAQVGPVAIMSCEMTKRRYIRRIHRTLAADSPELQRDLDSPERQVRFAAFEQLKPPPHPIHVLDPRDAKMSLRTLEGLAVEHRTIIVDHVGLLTNHAGKRAIEDWRVAAEISNVTKEVNLAADIALVLLSQINREGENTHGWQPPKPSKLVGTDALGQDADMVVTMARMHPGGRSMAYDLGKNREGPSGRFYSRFEPGTATYTEIDKDIALEIMREDQDKSGDA